jgi:hypothetical protein
VNSGVSNILVGSCPVEMQSSRCLGPRYLAGLRHTDTCDTAVPYPSAYRSQTGCGTDTWHMLELTLGDNLHLGQKVKLCVRLGPLIGQVQGRQLSLVLTVPQPRGTDSGMNRVVPPLSTTQKLAMSNALLVTPTNTLLQK